MKWWKDLTWLYRSRSSIHFTLEVHRDDINANTSECSKLLYRLEESELQVKNCQARLEQLEKRG